MSIISAAQDFEKKLLNTQIHLTMCTRLPGPDNRGGYFASSKDTAFLVADISDDGVIPIPIHQKGRPMMDLDTDDSYTPKCDHPSIKGLPDDYLLRDGDPRTIIKMTNGNEFLIVEDAGDIEQKIYDQLTILTRPIRIAAFEKLVKFDI